KHRWQVLHPAQEQLGPVLEFPGRVGSVAVPAVPEGPLPARPAPVASAPCCASRAPPPRDWRQSSAAPGPRDNSAKTWLFRRWRTFLPPPQGGREEESPPPKGGGGFLRWRLGPRRVTGPPAAGPFQGHLAQALHIDLAAAEHGQFGHQIKIALGRDPQVRQAAPAELIADVVRVAAVERSVQHHQPFAARL